jgi:hypothetical protein
MIGTDTIFNPQKLRKQTAQDVKKFKRDAIPAYAKPGIASKMLMEGM